jgi:hypothetical protein
MKSILIPTDFKPDALDHIPDLCNQSNGENLQLIFLHLFKISDSITDLLMLNRRNREYEYISDQFYLRCETIKADFPQIKSIKIDFFYGSTLSMFRNYLEAHAIDAVLDLANCSIKPLNKLSVDPTNLIVKCGLNVIRIKPEVQQPVTSYAFQNVLNEAV